MKPALALLILWFSVQATASENRFAQYPAEITSPTCKALDYDSYFIAKNAKANLISLNPTLDQPNFGGKYLLLRNEMMAETLYLIADCETGKFLKEKLSTSTRGKIEFKQESTLVAINEKDKESFQVWKEGEWIQVEDPAPPAPEPVTPQAGVAIAPAKKNYDSIFTQYSIPDSLVSCKSLQYETYFRAQQSKDTILKDNSNLDRPNFAGKYLLLKANLLFDTIYLIADCETGTFFQTLLKGEAHFSPKSTFVWVSESGDFPETYVWENTEWVQIHDPLRKTPPPIHHTLNRAQSEALIRFIKRDRRDTIIREETLHCESDCERALPWLKRRGSYFTHLQCDTHKVACQFDAEVKPQT